eukprot:TRINITY_DN12096_c0_g1_i1.p2 TRINITY_DN12096_c0_g1~~TRINITY_DN12096_c0_g1_i1.p2  ORF type:complete len:104 (+),score=18.45 TRINITY_DN12096_c0_g1_i1:304-615(+)
MQKRREASRFMDGAAEEGSEGDDDEADGTNAGDASTTGDRDGSAHGRHSAIEDHAAAAAAASRKRRRRVADDPEDGDDDDPHGGPQLTPTPAPLRRLATLTAH